jgi:hypothetical protein
MTTHRTFCRFCHAICGLEVDVEDGRAVAVRGDRAHPISQGYLCEKGKTGRPVSTDRDFEAVSGMPRQSAIPDRVRALDVAERTALEGEVGDPRS